MIAYYFGVYGKPTGIYFCVQIIDVEQQQQHYQLQQPVQQTSQKQRQQQVQPTSQMQQR
jgi:hypothetical protein